MYLDFAKSQFQLKSQKKLQSSKHFYFGSVAKSNVIIISACDITYLI